MNRLCGLVLGSVALFSTAGCARIPNEMSIAFDFFSESGGIFAKEAIVWPVGLFIVGVLFSLLVHQLFKKSGWYGDNGKVSKIAQYLAVGLLLIVVPSQLAMIGYQEGLYRGTRAALTTGPIAQDTLPSIGFTGADGIFVVLSYLDQVLKSGVSAEALPFPDEKLKQFQNGEMGYIPEGFEIPAGGIDDYLIKDVCNKVRIEMVKQDPRIAEGLTGSGFDLLMSGVESYLIENYQISGNGSSEFLGEAQHSSKNVNTEKQSPRVVLAHWLVSTTVVDPVVSTTRLYVRANQIGHIIPIVLILVLTPLVFIVVRRGTAKAKSSLKDFNK